MFEKLIKYFTSSKIQEIQTKGISREQIRYQQTGIIDDLINNSKGWINLNNSENFIIAWDTIPDLRTIISKLSNYFIKFNLKHYKEIKGELIDISENSPLINLLNNPNPLQDRNEFFEELYSFWNVTGNSFTRIISESSGFENDYTQAKAIYNLNPAQTDLIIKKSQFNEIDIYKIIDHYSYIKKNGEKPIPLLQHEIIHINDSNLLPWDENYGKGNSKLRSQKYQLTNLGIAYEAKNVLLTRRGALGMFTTGGGNQHAFPLSPEEEKEIQEKWQNHGITSKQWNILFTKASLTWQQIAMNTRDLMIYEGLEDDRKSLCAAFSLPYLLFITGGGEGSTYNNLNIASQQVYREKIIPDWGTIESAFNKYFQLQKKKEKLVFDYSHIDVLQEDEKERIKKENLQSGGVNKIIIAYNSNNISLEQAKVQLLNIMNINEMLIDELLIKPVQVEEEQQEQIIT